MDAADAVDRPGWAVFRREQPSEQPARHGIIPPSWGPLFGGMASWSKQNEGATRKVNAGTTAQLQLTKTLSVARQLPSVHHTLLFIKPMAWNSKRDRSRAEWLVRMRAIEIKDETATAAVSGSALAASTLRFGPASRLAHAYPRSSMRSNDFSSTVGGRAG